ncbi:MAG TPA: tetratricopeptide repeat protein, partial [Pirellulales bacterium]|nr:tetratricopeptide repeat protein [Pirellulales bacterium]
MRANLLNLSLALALVMPGAARAGPAEDQYAVAAGHYNQKRWKLAAEEFRKFLADYPDHAKAHRSLFYLAESQVQLGQFDDAAAAFRDFIRRAPDDALARKARFRAGEASFLGGRLDDAERDLSEFLKLGADDPLGGYALPYLGDIAAERHDVPAARKFYSEGLAKFPQGPLQDDCRFGLALALEQQGEHDEARRLYLALAAKAHSPWADDAQFRLGSSQYAAGDFAAALQSFSAFESKFEKSEWNDKAALAVGQTQFYLRKFDLAKARFESLADHPELGLEARYWLGLIDKELRNWDTAADRLLATAAAAEAHPLAPAVRFHAGDALLHAGKPADAAKQFDLVIERWPQNEFVDDCWLGKIQAAFSLDDSAKVDELVAAFVRQFADSPLRIAAEREQARSFLARKEPAKAASLLEGLLASATQKSPADTASLRNLLALAYLGLERYDDALATLGPVLALPGGELKSDALRAQATAQVARRSFADAVAPLEAFLKTSPKGDDEAWALAQLAICLARSKQLERSKQIYQKLTAQHAHSQQFAPTTWMLAEAALEAGDQAWSAKLFASLSAEGTPPRFAARGLSGTAWHQKRAGQLPEAAATFERLLAGYPDDPLAPEAALVRGQILKQLDEPDAALAMFQWVIDKYPVATQLPPALLGAARLQAKAGRHDAAAALFERFDREFPQLPEHETALYEWAWSLRDLGQPADADALFERLRAAVPHGRHWEHAVYRLAERAYQTKDYPRARALVNELIAGQAGANVLPHALFLQGQVAVASERSAEVDAPLERLVREFPESPLKAKAEFFQADAAYLRGDYSQAEARFTQLADETKGRNDTWLAMIPLRRAQMLANEERKQWSEALELALPIESQYPGFEQQYEVDYVVGRCLAAQGEFEQARAAYQRVVETGDKTETAAKAQWMIGESYFHQKNYSTALRAYLRGEILYDYPRWDAAALLQAGKCHEYLGEWKQAGE